MRRSPVNELPGSIFGKLCLGFFYVHQWDWPEISVPYIVLVGFWCQCFVSQNEWGMFPSSVIVNIDFQDCFFLFSAWVCSVQIWISNVHEKQKARDVFYSAVRQKLTNCLYWLVDFFPVYSFLEDAAFLRDFFFPVGGVSVLTPHTMWLKGSSLVLNGD